jgi:hypothetical protein
MDVFTVRAPLAEHREEVAVVARHQNAPGDHDACVTDLAMPVMIRYHIARLGLCAGGQPAVAVLSEDADQVLRVHPHAPLATIMPMQL